MTLQTCEKQRSVTTKVPHAHLLRIIPSAVHQVGRRAIWNTAAAAAPSAGTTRTRSKHGREQKHDTVPQAWHLISADSPPGEQ